MARLCLVSAAVLFWGSAMAATSTSDAPTQSPSRSPQLNQLTSQGCFGSPSNTTTLTKGVGFVSSGTCFDVCLDKDYPVMLLHGASCYCAKTYPSKDSLLKDYECNTPCPGYSKEACGGLETADSPNAYSVFNTGKELDVEYDDSSAKSSSAATAAATSSGSKGSSPTPSASGSDSSATSTETSSESTSTPTQASDANRMIQTTFGLVCLGLVLAI